MNNTQNQKIAQVTDKTLMLNCELLLKSTWIKG